jgi:hypothetical protein
VMYLQLAKLYNVLHIDLVLIVLRTLPSYSSISQRKMDSPANSTKRICCVFVAAHAGNIFYRLTASGWELGTYAQTLLELNASSCSVLPNKPLLMIAAKLTNAATATFGIAKIVVLN